jgi:hypothetical protein
MSLKEKQTRDRTEKSDSEKEDEEVEVEELEENDYEEDENSGEDDDNDCAIDLSQNEIYKGICTLFEDEEGNNILEYISLLHTELIGINKSMENLKGIRKEITRLADIAELMVKNKRESSNSSVASVKDKSSSEHSKKSSSRS